MVTDASCVHCMGNNSAVIWLAFVLAFGFLLLILSCALWSNWYPLLVGTPSSPPFPLYASLPLSTLIPSCPQQILIPFSLSCNFFLFSSWLTRISVYSTPIRSSSDPELDLL